MIHGPVTAAAPIARLRISLTPRFSEVLIGLDASNRFNGFGAVKTAEAVHGPQATPHHPAKTGVNETITERTIPR
jgi:hypothetical protein